LSDGFLPEFALWGRGAVWARLVEKPLSGKNLVLFCWIDIPCSTTIAIDVREPRSMERAAAAALLLLGMGLTFTIIAARILKLVEGF